MEKFSFSLNRFVGVSLVLFSCGLVFMVCVIYFIRYIGLLDIGLGCIFVFMLNIVFSNSGVIIFFGVFCVIICLFVIIIS